MELTTDKVQEYSSLIDNIIEFFQHFADLVQRLFASFSFKRAWEDTEYVYFDDANDPDAE